jgi:hypothetical protein
MLSFTFMFTGQLVNNIIGTFPNPLTTTRNKGCCLPGSFTGRAFLLFPILVLDNDCFVGTREHRGEETAIPPHSFVDEVTHPGEANDESLFLVVLKKLVVELPSVTSSVYCINPLGADMGGHGINDFEALLVLAFEVLRFLGVSLQVEGDDLGMCNIGGYCFCQPVPIS